MPQYPVSPLRPETAFDENLRFRSFRPAARGLCVLAKFLFFLSRVGQRCPKDQDHALTDLGPFFKLEGRLSPFGAGVVLLGPFFGPNPCSCLPSMSSCPRPERKTTHACRLQRKKGGPANHGAGASLINVNIWQLFFYVMNFHMCVYIYIYIWYYTHSLKYCIHQYSSVTDCLGINMKYNK